MDNVIETAGQFLRRKREERHISVEAVALQTRIQAVFINAIEEDRLDKIASLVSARGFVRSYARFLKVDEAETLKRISELSASPNIGIAETRAVEETPVQTSLFPRSASRPLAEKRRDPDSSYEPILDMGTVGLRIRTTPPYFKLVGISIVCLSILFLLKLFIPWGNKKSLIVAPVQTRIEGAPTLRETPSPLVSAVPTLPEKEVPIVSVSSGPSATPKPFILSLEAREPTWVKVLVDGKGTKNVLLQTGQKVVWQADKTFLLTMGNGGGAEVFLDGKELGFLGKKGQVVRDRLLTRVASEQTATDDD